MHIARLFLAIIFFVAGLNGYFVILGYKPFLVTSPEAVALFKYDYLLIAEKSIEIICGILLLMNRYVPLAIATLSPIVANILLFHIFLDHSLLILAMILTIAYGYLLFYYRNNFKGVLEKKSR